MFKFIQMYNLILEGKLDDDIKKYKLSKEDEDKVRKDSKNIKQDKIKKYSEFLIKNRDVQNIVELINYFENNPNKFNGISIDNVSVEEIKRVMDSNLEKKEDDKKIRSEADIVFDDGEWLIISPKSWKASCRYGYGTKWCISMEDDKSYWGDHADKFDKFYFVIDKNERYINNKAKRKFAIQVEVDGNIIVWNSIDKKISYDEFELLVDKEFDRSLFKPNDISKIDVIDIIKKCVIPNDVEVVKNKDGSYDIEGSIIISKALVDNGKLKVRFRTVGSEFVCSGLKLTSLDGCPVYVGSHFYCSNNNLVSLSGCPEKVVGDFECFGNFLSNLKFGPIEVFGNFNCSENQLETLDSDNRFKKVYGNFVCSGNKLKDLVGIPAVENTVDCSHNELESLNGLQYSKSLLNLDCSYNNLTSLKFCSSKIMYKLYCNNNKLRNLDYFPSGIQTQVDCSDNAVKFSRKEVSEKCEAKTIYV